MTSLNQHIITGRVGDKEVELRYTPNGTPVVSFSIAHTPRVFNRDTNTWADGETTWYRVSAYNRLAEDAAASLGQGNIVTVVGNLKASTYNTKDGETRLSLDIRAEDISISLDLQTVQKVEKAYGTKTQGGVAPQNGQAPRQNTSYNNAGQYNNDEDTPF